MPGIYDLDPATELPLVHGLGDVAPEAIAELAALVVQHRVPAREVVSEQGQIPLGLFVLVRGAVKVVRIIETAQGEVARVLAVLRAPSLILDAAVFDGLPSEASIVPLRTSQLFVLERRALQKTMTAHASLQRALFARLVRESRSHVRRMDELATGSVEERVHRLLDALGAQHGTPLGHGRFIPLPLRRRDLASMVNATTETVSRLLAQLERDGRVRSTRDGIWWRSVTKKPVTVEAEVAPATAAGAHDDRRG